MDQNMIESTLAMKDLMSDLYNTLPVFINPSISAGGLSPTITVQPVNDWNHVLTIDFEIKSAEYVITIGDRYSKSSKNREIKVSMANPNFKCEITEIVIDFVEEIIEYWSNHLKEAKAENTKKYYEIQGQIC